MELLGLAMRAGLAQGQQMLSLESRDSKFLVSSIFLTQLVPEGCLSSTLLSYSSSFPLVTPTTNHIKSCRKWFSLLFLHLSNICSLLWFLYFCLLAKLYILAPLSFLS